MKFKLNLKNKEASVEADVEKVLEKQAEHKHIEKMNGKHYRKTKFQIREEEKRKTMELKHKQNMQKAQIALIVFGGILGAVLFIIVFAGIISLFN